MLELVSNGTTGLLFKAGDHHDLALKCGTLLEDAELRARMGKAGREAAVRERSWPTLVAQYPIMYDRLLRQHTPVGSPIPYEIRTPCR
jgi:glycosyltransferase involved in cell wall biosynthesis